MRIPNLTLQLLLGDQRCDRIDNHHIHGVGFDQHLSDLHRFFATCGLANEQRIQLHAQLFCPRWIKRVLRIDESGHSPIFLSLGDHMQRECRLATRFWTVNFDNSTLGKPLPPQRHVQRKTSRRNASNLISRIISKGHDRAVTEQFLNLLDGIFQIFIPLQNCIHRGIRFSARLLCLLSAILFGHGRVHYFCHHVISILSPSTHANKAPKNHQQMIKRTLRVQVDSIQPPNFGTIIDSDKLVDR